MIVFIGPDSIFACVKVLPKANKHPEIYNRVNDGNVGNAWMQIVTKECKRAAQACSVDALFAGAGRAC